MLSKWLHLMAEKRASRLYANSRFAVFANLAKICAEKATSATRMNAPSRFFDNISPCHGPSFLFRAWFSFRPWKEMDKSGRQPQKSARESSITRVNEKRNAPRNLDDKRIIKWRQHVFQCSTEGINFAFCRWRTYCKAVYSSNLPITVGIQ